VRLPLSAEVAAARAVGRLSRLAGAGGGTTLPGKLLSRVDPSAVERLARRLPQGTALVSATNGKTTTAAMLAEILRGRARLAHNRAGANLLSGVASSLLESRTAELGLFEVDEAALSDVARRVHPRAVCLGNLFRDQLDRYGELELVAERWRRTVDALPESSRLVVNGDDPQVGDLGRDRAGTVAFGLDDERHALAHLPHAADTKWCVRCGTPYDYAASYVGHLGDYRCPACGHRRPPLDVVARSINLDGLEAAEFDLVVEGRSTRVRLPLPGLYNVYNAVAAAALAVVLGVDRLEAGRGLERFSAAFGRFERIPVGDRTVLLLLIKNPAGANEVVRTLVAAGVPRLLVVALNDAIADGRDVSWIWDVDFEPLLAAEALERLILSGERAAELALRCRYGGFPVGSLEVVSDLGGALDRALALTPPGGEVVALPTYTAMLALQQILAERGYARPYWERTPAGQSSPGSAPAAPARSGPRS
jgi:lipid II isoglutaminyl synthase (glutamine-hydrolysing)